jgi:hypothetical protein
LIFIALVGVADILALVIVITLVEVLAVSYSPPFNVGKDPPVAQL